MRKALIALALLAPLGLAACSGFTPVYGERAIGQQQLAFSYSKPNSRLEQIAVQQLMLQLGSSDNPGSPRITISVSAGTRALTRTNVVKPSTQYQATAIVSFTVADRGEILASGTRTASAAYTTVGQVLADEQAFRDASERATRAATETVRLSILGALANPVIADAGQ